MALLQFYALDPAAVGQLNLEQIVAAAGDGRLLDNSKCSDEFREFLSLQSTNRLEEFLNHCLDQGFTKSGMVLQDVVNELGRRLGYKVTAGRYQGVKGENGFDGLWQDVDGHYLIVEVKTTDTYRLSLDTLARYRNGLRNQEQIGEASSILIVVGRQDTGELEAQIRGSRHA